MNRNHELLQTEEFYSQSVEMIKRSISGIKGEMGPIKNFLRERRREIFKLMSEARQAGRSCTYDFTKMFYQYALKQITNMEESCERSLVQLNIELLAATTSRTQSPFYLLPEEMKKVYAICCGALDETEDGVSCHCTWENIPKWSLDDTQNIIAKPKAPTRTEHDESDSSFKQDILYLRTKMFSLPRKRDNVNSDNEILSGPSHGNYRSSVRLSLKTADFFEALNEREISVPFSVEDELLKLASLKFVDGKFTTCDGWLKILDVHGHLYGSKWNLVLCPQVEKIAKNRLIPALRLSPQTTFAFISQIKTFSNFRLDRKDLVALLKDEKDAIWLNSWRMQFDMIDGQHVAATVIQAAWRGYWLRRKRWLSSRLYIAASTIWFAWLTSKHKIKMHHCYLQNMLISLQTTRELTLKLINEFYTIIEHPHVVVHLPSLGHPMELRRILDPKMFSIFQNISILRMCFVRNPKTEVIYILPVKPTQDLLMMYSDLIEAISPDEDIAKRITFIALSQVETFKNRPLNVSRILHCSEDTLREIRKKIAGKSAYFLPSIIDECDMRVAGSLNIPLLSTDMELQRNFLNVSKMSELIHNLGLLQPPHVRNITDFDTLCESLAQLMVLHTEVCMWMIKLNYGIVTKHSGIFLINHISVPFMPVLRRERGRHGDDWKVQSSLREQFLEKLREHLPKVIPSVTQLSKNYGSWKQFYIHIQKFGCMLQAIPMKKKSRTVVVSLFIPGKATKRKPRWLGTADKIYFDSTVPSIIYMLPQSSLDLAQLEPTVNILARGMQDRGYFGYMSVDCYCYIKKPEEKLVVWLLNVFPYYTFSHSFLDWIKFAINGWYCSERDKFISTVKTSVDVSKRRSSGPFLDVTPAWNETVERFAIAITQVHHSRFAAYRWSNLKNIFEKCGIFYNRGRRTGSSIILHDGNIRTVGLMMCISPSMTNTLSMIHSNLTKLNQSLTLRSKRNVETNLPDLISVIFKLYLDYENLAADICESKP